MLIKQGDAKILEILPEEEIDALKAKEALEQSKKNIATGNNSELSQTLTSEDKSN